jgi:hypothetical protein
VPVRRFTTAVIVVSVVVLVGTAALVVSPSLREFVGVGPQVEPPAYRVGDRVDVASSLYASSPRTLLLFARSSCAACQRSEPFHQAAIAAAQQAHMAVALLTPTTDLEAEATYAARLGLTRDQVHHITPGSIRLRTVPTLMLVDSDGRIHDVWFDVADAATETAILARLSDAQNGDHP